VDDLFANDLEVSMVDLYSDIRIGVLLKVNENMGSMNENTIEVKVVRVNAMVSDHEETVLDHTGLSFIPKLRTYLSDFVPLS